MSQSYTKLSRLIEEENQKTATLMAKKAKYKIQIWFRSDRSLKKPVAFSLSFWESGKRLHGGGDEMMFICKRHEGAPDVAKKDISFGHKITPGKRGCGLLIPGEWSGGIVVCPSCGAKHDANQVGDSIFYRVSIDNAAKILHTWWLKLGGTADLYAKYTPTDPRTLMMATGQDIRTAREKKGLTIYPLENILKDTITGASVEGRFKAFITA